MMRDEGPSEADLQQFSGDDAICPECGAEIWDQAESCPECHAWVGGATVSRKPLQRWWRRKWLGLVVIALIVAIMFWWVL